VTVGVVGQGLQCPRSLPTAEVENTCRRLPVRPAQEPVDVDTEDRGRDRVVRVRDAAEPLTIHRKSEHEDGRPSALHPAPVHQVDDALRGFVRAEFRIKCVMSFGSTRSGPSPMFASSGTTRQALLTITADAMGRNYESRIPGRHATRGRRLLVRSVDHRASSRGPLKLKAVADHVAEQHRRRMSVRPWCKAVPQKPAPDSCAPKFWT